MKKNKRGTIEKQYQFLLEKKQETMKFGLMSGHVWRDDPKRVTFILSRYKFIAKMLSGKKRVLEVGCADAFASRIVRQFVGSLTAIDFDPIFIENAKKTTSSKLFPIKYLVHDMVEKPLEETFDAVYAIDVIEHIPVEKEKKFFSNIIASLTPQGVCILGSPTLESQIYASKYSKEGHVNCKTGEDLKELMNQYFHNTFLFSMNDEVVHTGFEKMAHYLIVIGCGPRRPNLRKKS